MQHFFDGGIQEFVGVEVDDIFYPAREVFLRSGQIGFDIVDDVTCIGTRCLHDSDTYGRIVAAFPFS